MAVRVVTDSACDLPESICAELGIEVVPLSIRFGDEELCDRTELTTGEFWRRLPTAPQLPETAAPSVGAFETVFRRLADEGATGIICINLSSGLSATMQSAQLGAKALEGLCPVEIIDSECASMGIGLLVLHAARRANEGASLEEITAEVLDQRGRTHALFTVDTLEYLRKGGRIGGAQAFLGSVLSIKPVITVVDGKVEPFGKVRTRSKALKFIVDHVGQQEIEELCVLQGNAADLEEFRGLVAAITPAGQTPIEAEIGPVVGVHTGPGIIGLVWRSKS